MKRQDIGVFLRFLIAGSFNTLFGLAAYSLLILAQAPPWLALLLGLIAAVLFNFFTISAYAFRDLALKRLPRFILAYAIIYLTNLCCLQGLRTWIAHPILAQLVLTPPMSLLSYALMKGLVFSRKPDTPEDTHHP